MPASVEYASIRQLARDFGSVPMELRREIRPRMRIAGAAVVSDLRSESSRFSSSIPAAIRMTTSFTSKTGGVRIWIDKNKAPGARAIENLGRSGTFRHPVFGNRDAWVAQEAHPFFFPVIARHRARVRTLVEDAVRASFPKGRST